MKRSITIAAATLALRLLLAGSASALPQVSDVSGSRCDECRVSVSDVVGGLADTAPRSAENPVDVVQGPAGGAAGEIQHAPHAL